MHCGQIEASSVLVPYACATLRRNFLCVGGLVILRHIIVNVITKNRMELAEKKGGVHYLGNVSIVQCTFDM